MNQTILDCVLMLAAQVADEEVSAPLSDLYKVGDYVRCLVLRVRPDKRTISLSIKPSHFKDDKPDEVERTDSELSAAEQALLQQLLAAEAPLTDAPSHGRRAQLKKEKQQQADAVEVCMWFVCGGVYTCVHVCVCLYVRDCTVSFSMLFAPDADVRVHSEMKVEADGEEGAETVQPQQLDLLFGSDDEDDADEAAELYGTEVRPLTAYCQAQPVHACALY